jgi:hypothetical protein
VVASLTELAQVATSGSGSRLFREQHFAAYRANSKLNGGQAVKQRVEKVRTPIVVHLKLNVARRKREVLAHLEGALQRLDGRDRTRRRTAS